MTPKPKSKKTANVAAVAAPVVPKSKPITKKKLAKAEQPAPSRAPISPLPTTLRTKSTTAKKLISMPAKPTPKSALPPTTASVKKPMVAEKKIARETVVTEQARLTQLKELVSLKKSSGPVVESESGVDARSGPPPALSTPLEIEATPSGTTDRGQPIPDHYGMDRLVVLARDAHWLFAYWELKGGALDRLRFHHSAEVIDNARWVLRVQTVHDQGEYLVDVDMRIGQWYLKVSADTRFIVDLGFTNQDADFVPVLQGIETRTPRQAVSNVVDERWIIAREDLEKLVRVNSAHPVEGVTPGSLGSSGNVPRITRSELPRATGLFAGLWANRQAQ